MHFKYRVSGEHTSQPAHKEWWPTFCSALSFSASLHLSHQYRAGWPKGPACQINSHCLQACMVHEDTHFGTLEETAFLMCANAKCLVTNFFARQLNWNTRKYLWQNKLLFTLVCGVELKSFTLNNKVAFSKTVFSEDFFNLFLHHKTHYQFSCSGLMEVSWSLHNISMFYIHCTAIQPFPIYLIPPKQLVNTASNCYALHLFNAHTVQMTVAHLKLSWCHYKLRRP